MVMQNRKMKLEMLNLENKKKIALFTTNNVVHNGL
jgi:hypothetical protein